MLLNIEYFKFIERIKVKKIDKIKVDIFQGFDEHFGQAGHVPNIYEVYSKSS